MWYREKSDFPIPSENKRADGKIQPNPHQLIEKNTENDPTNWDKWLPYILLSYRSRIQTTTKLTPFELMFGRTMNAFESWVETEGHKEDEEILQRANEIQHLRSPFHKNYWTSTAKKLSKELFRTREKILQTRLSRMERWFTYAR
jgi:hypothetical protein